MPLVKSFMLRTLFSLFVINVLAIFLVEFDSNLVGKRNNRKHENLSNDNARCFSYTSYHSFS